MTVAVTEECNILVNGEEVTGTKGSFQARGTAIRFVTKPDFTVKSCLYLVQSRS